MRVNRSDLTGHERRRGGELAARLVERYATAAIAPGVLAIWQRTRDQYELGAPLFTYLIRVDR